MHLVLTYSIHLNILIIHLCAYLQTPSGLSMGRDNKETVNDATQIYIYMHKDMKIF